MTRQLLGCFLYKNDFFFAGYGNIVQKTVQGRLFCVLYALKAQLALEYLLAK